MAARIFSAWLIGMFCMSAGAVIEIEPLSSPELEARYRELIEELRCPKCQNQNLAASNSPIASDLRAQVRTLLEEGKSDREIVAYLVDRYGDFVRYRPPVQENTLLLWFGPGLLLLAGAVVVFLVVRIYRRSREAPGADLSPGERERLDALVSGNDSDDRSRSERS